MINQSKELQREYKGALAYKDRPQSKNKSFNHNSDQAAQCSLRLSLHLNLGELGERSGNQ